MLRKEHKRLIMHTMFFRMLKLKENTMQKLVQTRLRETLIMVLEQVQDQALSHMHRRTQVIQIQGLIMKKKKEQEISMKRF